ncbi:MAG: hypothetical protein R3C58_04935 [Parvularculaceae bacterium]
MFVGHYGPAAAAAGRRIKLWHGFVAVQFLDILWAPFVLLGFEHVRIVERFTASNHFDLYHMPWTHSLVMALVWSVLAGVVYNALRKGGGIVIGALVFSHWILDFITHKPDLELWFGGPKVGLALWDNRPLAVSLEFALLIVGLAMYLARTKAKGVAGAAAPFVLLALLAAAQLFGNFGPAPADGREAAMSAIIAYAVFAVLAAIVDATRAPKR